MNELTPLMVPTGATGGTGWPTPPFDSDQVRRWTINPGNIDRNTWGVVLKQIVDLINNRNIMGPNGPAGTVTGPTGPAGAPTGPTGPARPGPTGPAASTGATGPTGLWTGPQGPQG